AFGIAVNHVRNHVRKKQHHQIAVQEQLLTHLAAYHAEQQSLFDDLHENLRGCLDKLPANQRHILSCFYDEEASPMQIARAEGKTSNAIYKLLKKIRQTLYECLTKNVAEWRLS
ncbi:MAG TPA: hypothetical protein VNQ76_13935, partial [Planctomicrobium sp.]|nr:hypothetical protein [Planctomicrobium sp.]